VAQSRCAAAAGHLRQSRNVHVSLSARYTVNNLERLHHGTGTPYCVLYPSGPHISCSAQSDTAHHGFTVRDLARRHVRAMTSAA